MVEQMQKCIKKQEKTIKANVPKTMGELVSSARNVTLLFIFTVSILSIQNKNVLGIFFYKI